MSPYCIYVCTSIADQKICSALISIPSKHETFAKFDRMLGQRRRRWTSTAPTLGERHVFAGLSLISGTQLIQCLFSGCDAGTIIIGPMSSLAADALFTVQRGADTTRRCRLFYADWHETDRKKQKKSTALTASASLWRGKDKTRLRDINSMLVQSRPIVCDDGPTSYQHRVNVSQMAWQMKTCSWNQVNSKEMFCCKSLRVLLDYSTASMLATR